MPSSLTFWWNGLAASFCQPFSRAHTRICVHERTANIRHFLIRWKVFWKKLSAAKAESVLENLLAHKFF